jgi:dienelactone hydrolase
MTIQTRLVEYASGGHTYEGMLAWDDAADGPRPGVLVAHTIAGRSAHELQARLLAGLDCLRDQPEVDAAKTAAIGFCFGGLSVLDLARTGADVAGVVSLHGIFVPPGNTEGNRITAKVLALHGWEDPLATPEEVVALADELTSMGADWQIHAYGNTTHAFTNPAADDREGGKQYNAAADRRSWTATEYFLAELFGN